MAGGSVAEVTRSEPGSEGNPVDEAEASAAADRDAAIEEAIQEQVERLVARAAKVGAWGQAEEYCRARFTGRHLEYALSELRLAEEEARRRKGERKAA
jgi:hypothetical protein